MESSDDRSGGDYGRLPMEETEEPYVYEEDQEIAQQYKYDDSVGGKWILFFDLDLLNDGWVAACKAYREKKLLGIRSIRASTANRCNPKYPFRTQAAMMFRCGPMDNEELIIKYGQCLVETLNYRNNQGHIPYKSDAQSALGTRWTGNKNNSLYIIRFSRASTSGCIPHE